MKKYFNIANIILILSVIIGDIFYIINNDSLLIKSITSALFVLIGFINLIFVLKNKTLKKSFAILMVIGLTFAMLGDIVLELQFIIGAALFAIGHIFYFFAYCSLSRLRWKELIYGAIIFIPVTLFILLAPFFDFGSILMEIVCIVYAVIISNMVGKSIANYVKYKSILNLTLMIGSILFMFSDFMLLLNVFADVPRIVGILCLVSYYPAECLLGYALLTSNSTKVELWLKSNCTDLKDKRIVVTGATGGLGKEICLILAKLHANIIIACRNKNKADKLIEDIKEKYTDAKIDFVELDFTNLRTVKKCITELKKYNGIDVLINNAGIYNVPVETLDSGYNNIFQVNHLYTYYFTKELLRELEKKENSSCITLGSVAHNYSKLNQEDISFLNQHKPSKIYGNSKRFLMFSLFELFKDKKVKLAIVHPGVTLTNMTNHYPKAINWLVKLGIKLLFPSPNFAVLSVINGIYESTSYHEWIGPRHFNIWGSPKKSKLKTCSEEESQKIYKITEDIIKEIK